MDTSGLESATHRKVDTSGLESAPVQAGTHRKVDTSGLESATHRKVDTSGLESAPVLLIKSELANPSYHQSSVASPDALSGNRCYKNRPSGTATLAHPLTVVKGTRETEETDSVVTQLLDPDYSVSYCVDSVLLAS